MAKKSFFEVATAGLGVTYKLVEEQSPVEFFQPEDFGYRALTIATSPISAAVISLTGICVMVLAIVDIVQDLMEQDNDSAFKTFTEGFVGSLTFIVLGLIGFFIAPIINLIDLIGSAIMSIGAKSDENQGSAMPGAFPSVF